MHHEWTMHALRAGKHVLCEKPYSTRVADVHEAYDLADARNLVLSEGFMWRHHPQAAALRETLPELGELQTIRATFAFVLGPDRATDIRIQADLEGGSLMDVGCYCVSGARLLAGEEPETVYGRAVWGPTRVDLRFTGVLRFPSGVMAEFTSGFTMDHRGLEAIGDEGSAMLLDPWQADPATLVRDGEVTHWHPDDPNPMEVPYFHEFDNFSAAVRGEAELLLGRDHAAGQARVLGALYEFGSDRQGDRALTEAPQSAANNADIVIVGAGAAGCVLARRLAERTGAAILLLEAGGEPDANAAPDGWRLGKPADWGFTSEPGPSGGSKPLRRGRLLGGTSWLTRFAVRGAAADFDAWAARGNPGWAWVDVLPAFRRLESDVDFGGETWHGSDGPLPIARYPDLPRSDIHRAAIEALRESGFGAVADHNDGASVGIGPMPMSVRDDRRVTTFGAYLSPGERPPTVTIRSHAEVDSVLLEGHRSVGVRLVEDGTEFGHDGHPRRRYVRQPDDPDAFGDRPGGTPRRRRHRHRCRPERCRRQPGGSPWHRLRQWLAGRR